MNVVISVVCISTVKYDICEYPQFYTESETETHWYLLPHHQFQFYIVLQIYLNLMNYR